ncbi:uncharacterized protein LOC112572906 [Pomacea canaliculata]|nr:uncharacterized protein LOC112572906 [Pomacea canaliculata]XP_025108689.1 uncharacterized protein LOC112572906 [Pomacea canaliculata]
MAFRIRKWMLGLCLAYSVSLIIHQILLQQAWRQFENDMNVLNYFSVCLLVASVYSLQHAMLFSICLFCKVFQLLVLYGWKRFCIYLVFVCLFCFFVVLILDGTTMYIWNLSKGEVVRRFQENIIEVDESRPDFEKVRVHPLTGGKTPPLLLYEIFRYRDEDAEFTCERQILWLSGGRPYVQQVVWRKNGKPLPRSLRFRQELTFTELTEDQNLLTKIAKEHHLSVYKITATLTIYLIKSYDFGNYTCHVAEMVQNSIQEWMVFLNERIQASKAHSDFPGSFQHQGESKSTEENKNELSVKTSVEDMYTPSHEFRLIEVHPSQMTRQAPPGAILVFKTSYWHLSESNDDVSEEYFINEQSTQMGTCNRRLNGCSVFLLLYWFYSYEYTIFPPFVQNYQLKAFPDRAKIHHHHHCLCEKTYGHHSIYYLRRFYNSRKKKYELLEVYHPDDLVVLPREQDMLYLFQNRTSNVNNEQCPTTSDMHFVNMAANAFTSLYESNEKYVAGLGMFVSFIILWLSRRLIRVIGNFGGRMILDQTVAFLPRLEHRQTENQQGMEDAKTKFSKKHFDFFLSVTDSDAELVTGQILPILEARGHKVCLPDRDIPPNLQVISALSTAVDNSDRYIVILSSEYLKDRFKRNLELDMIGNKASCSDISPQSSLLCIKLDDCELLPWMKSFQVHDWTTFLSRENQLNRLSRWVQLGTKQNAKRECYELVFILIPFICLFVFSVIFVQLLGISNVALSDTLIIKKLLLMLTA